MRNSWPAAACAGLCLCVVAHGPVDARSTDRQPDARRRRRPAARAPICHRRRARSWSSPAPSAGSSADAASPRATRSSTSATTGLPSSSRRSPTTTATSWPTATARSISAWPTISATATASRWPESDHNYLELYGVPPTLSVLRARFLDSLARAPSCADVDFAKLRAGDVDPAARRQGRAEVRGQDRGLDEEARGAAPGAAARVARRARREASQAGQGGGRGAALLDAARIVPRGREAPGLRRHARRLRRTPSRRRSISRGSSTSRCGRRSSASSTSTCSTTPRRCGPTRWPRSGARSLENDYAALRARAHRARRLGGERPRGRLGRRQEGAADLRQRRAARRCRCATSSTRRSRRP